MKFMKGPGRMVGQNIHNFFEKPATIEYPSHGVKEPKLEPNYRGRLIYNAEDCINCHICMRDCPTGAITIVNDGTKTERKMRAELDLGRCIFCCQCVDSCPKKCLSYSQNIDLSAHTKEGLKVPLTNE